MKLRTYTSKEYHAACSVASYIAPFIFATSGGYLLFIPDELHCLDA